MLRQHDFSAGKQGGSLHRIAKLADVPRPAVVGEARGRRGGKPGLPARELPDEMAGQGHDVLRPVAQRRNVDLHHVEPIEQILAKQPRGDLRLEVAVGRGKDAGVRAKVPVRADPRERAVVNHPQELGLKRRRQLRDFIEKDRPAVRLLEPADALLEGPGERSLFMAEKLALQEVLRNRGAVYPDHGSLCARAPGMNQVGDDFLAHPAFAREQDSRLGRGDQGGVAENRLHEGTAADDSGRHASFRLRAGDGPAAPFRGQLDRRDEFIQVKRLCEVVDGPVAHRRDRAADVREGRDEQDGQRRMVLPDAPEGLDARHPGHPHVADHHREGLRLEHLQGRLAGCRRAGPVALGAKECLQQAPLPIVVVHDQNGRGRGGSLLHGCPAAILSRLNRNRAPRGSFATHTMSQRWAAAICCTIASPRPTPLGRMVT